MLLVSVLLAGAAFARASAASDPTAPDSDSIGTGDGFAPGTEAYGSAPGSSGALNDADVAELNSLALQAEAEATPEDGNGTTTSNSTTAGTTGNVTSSDTSTFVNIREKDTPYLLATAADGNFQLVGKDAIAGVNFLDGGGGVVLVDDNNRLMHYFPETIAKYGVSRFRVADETKFPKTANLITLSPITAAGIKDMYVAVDTLGNIFFPAICFLKGTTPKIFLVKDPVAGVNALMTNTDLRFTITGAAVQNCSTIVFVGSDAESSS